MSEEEKLIYIVNNDVKLTPELAKDLNNGKVVSLMTLVDFGKRVLKVEMRIVKPEWGNKDEQ